VDDDALCRNQNPISSRLQALHRVRDRIVSNRTQLIWQMRAFCLVYGIAMRQGAGVFKIDISRVIADESNDLTPMMRAVLKELWDEFVLVDTRLAAVTRQVEAIRTPGCRQEIDEHPRHWSAWCYRAAGCSW
jgi:transposase